MRIFADFHHSGLFYSLKLLLEDRLGHELFRPVGMEWWPEWWDIAKPYNQNKDTAKQYLSLNQDYLPVDHTVPLNTIKQERYSHYEISELAHGYTQKALTLEQFIEMDIDIIIASIPDHYVTYTKLRDKYKPKAKVICQVGNILWDDPIKKMVGEGIIRNLMASTKSFPTTCHSVFYHQEQPLREFVEPPFTKKIGSFVHLLPARPTYEKYKEEMNDITYTAHGAGAPDGYYNTLQDVYRGIQNVDMVWHVKPFGDGFGWVWHSVFMLGRPIITNFSDYKDKLGGLLFEDGVTGIDLELRYPKKNQDLIREIMSDKDRLHNMCLSAFDRFRAVVNYEEEQKRIELFLEALV